MFANVYRRTEQELSDFVQVWMLITHMGQFRQTDAISSVDEALLQPSGLRHAADSSC